MLGQQQPHCADWGEGAGKVEGPRWSRLRMWVTTLDWLEVLPVNSSGCDSSLRAALQRPNERAKHKKKVCCDFHNLTVWLPKTDTKNFLWWLWREFCLNSILEKEFHSVQVTQQVQLLGNNPRNFKVTNENAKWRLQAKLVAKGEEPAWSCC